MRRENAGSDGKRWILGLYLFGTHKKNRDLLSLALGSRVLHEARGLYAVTQVPEKRRSELDKSAPKRKRAVRSWGSGFRR